MMLNNIYFSRIKHIIDIATNVAWMIGIKLFKFWTTFDADRWPTDLVSCRQVEAKYILKDIYYYLFMEN